MVLSILVGGTGHHINIDGLLTRFIMKRDLILCKILIELGMVVKIDENGLDIV